MPRLIGSLVVLMLVAAACGGSGDDAAATTAPTTASTAPAPAAAPTTTIAPSTTTAGPTPPNTLGERPAGALRLADGSEVPPRPEAATGPLAAGVASDLDVVFSTLETGVDLEALGRLGASGDPRLGWLMSDLLRFFQQGPVADGAVDVFEQITGADVTARFVWGQVTDWLIAWDMPAPPDYVRWKRIPFEIIEPAWGPFFSDADAAIDWRFLSWGGVLIDDRPIDQVTRTCARGCIPALNDPIVTDAAGGAWLADDRIVFGVVVGDEARAYPKHMMEVHEMVNDTLGGRRIGIPYCTLCGSAQAYFTDAVPGGFQTVELRTSGLLTRSNKVMFDLHTFSVFDTFLGTALSGPLQDAGFTLEMASVVTTTWGRLEDRSSGHDDRPAGRRPGTHLLARSAQGSRRRRAHLSRSVTSTRASPSRSRCSAS